MSQGSLDRALVVVVARRKGRSLAADVRRVVPAEDGHRRRGQQAGLEEEQRTL
jgi:hypothetical protein